MHLSRPSTALIRGAVALVFLCLAPATAFAQSSIAGVARDESGGVLPGVTVEAASPVLIEKIRTVVTDDQGQFKIVDLRPGVYSVTFTLQGFNTFKRDGITLETDTVATVNGDMKVGALEETITVTGEAPLVDVQSSVRQQVVNRDLLDVLPTGRQMWGVGTALPGIVVNGQDVGGSGGIQQSKVSVHGADVNQTVTQVDGMTLNTLVASGSAVPYFNDGMAEEMSFQTSAMGAETAAGGVRVNIIPREGGNDFKGALFFGTIPNENFQSANLDDGIRKLGLTTQPTHLGSVDINASIGGPIKRDRLWFFSSFRYIDSDNTVPDAFYADGRQAIDDNTLKQGGLRLTYRPHSEHKLTSYYELTKKFRGHDSLSAGVDEIAAIRRPPINYSNFQVKWTGTLSPKLLVETGYSLNVSIYYQTYQPGVKEERGTPAWYSKVSRQDIILGTRRVAANPENYHYPYRNTVSSAVSYVTGTHAVKVGYQWGFGPYRNVRDMNGDLVQRYRNGVPDSVIVYNTPVDSRPYLKADLGIYAQDSWTRDRLTMNYGLRFDYFNSYIQEQSAAAGRFVPARRFDEILVPIFKDLVPRFGVSYDLFGDGKTAVKASVSKYMSQFTTDYANTYNPMFLSSDTRTWNDVNRDDLAQENEIGPSNNNQFGVRQDRNPDPKLKREYNIEYATSIQRQLTQTVSASVGYYRRGFHRLQRQDNLLITPADYTPVDIGSPFNGEQLTVYNLNRAKQGLVQILDTNDPNRLQIYNGFEVTAEARLPGGGRILTGMTRDRTVSRNCGVDDPNNPQTGLTNTAGAGGRFCDQAKLDIPFRNQFKLSGTYPMALGIQLSGVFVSFPGDQRRVDYSVGRGIIPTLTQTTVTVPLVAPGTKFLKQWNQLDFGLAKVFDLSPGRNFRVQVDIFNTLNSNVITASNQTWGPNLDRPEDILLGRLVRFGAQFRF